MTPKGLYDPFQSGIGNRQYRAKLTDEPKGDVRLDGKTHVIVLRQTVIEEIPRRLGALINAVSVHYAEELSSLGICIGPPTRTWESVQQMSPTVVSLHTPHGILRVCADKQNEDEAFQRLGSALAMLRIRHILDKHQTNIVVRG